jgi:hypothetical protein
MTISSDSDAEKYATRRIFLGSLAHCRLFWVQISYYSGYSFHRIYPCLQDATKTSINSSQTRLDRRHRLRDPGRIGLRMVSKRNAKF